MNINDYKIIVSNHAIQRLKERFYWTFSNYFSNRYVTESLIIAQLKNSKYVWDWKNVPFYYNKMCTEYNSTNLEVFTKSGVFYLCRTDEINKKLLVATCVKRFFIY